jgi:hypothetical protein
MLKVNSFVSKSLLSKKTKIRIIIYPCYIVYYVYRFVHILRVVKVGEYFFGGFPKKYYPTLTTRKPPERPWKRALWGGFSHKALFTGFRF